MSVMSRLRNKYCLFLPVAHWSNGICPNHMLTSVCYKLYPPTRYNMTKRGSEIALQLNPFIIKIMIQI